VIIAVPQIILKIQFVDFFHVIFLCALKDSFIIILPSGK